MKNLNYFQARALAFLQGRALRLEAEWLTQWLIHRSHTWLIAQFDPATGWLFREPLNADLNADAYFAKNWTDEPAENQAIPPCTTPGPATELAPNDMGGAQTWSYTDACDGGTGASGVVSGVDDTGPSLDVFEIQLGAIVDVPLLAGVTYDPTTGRYTQFPIAFRGPVEVTGIFNGPAPAYPVAKQPRRAYVWVIVNGDLGGAMAEPYVFDGDHISALSGAVGPLLMDTVPSPLPVDWRDPSFIGGSDHSESSDLTHLRHFGLPAGIFDAIAMQPGDTVKARIDVITGNGARYTFIKTVTLPAWWTPPSVAIGVATTVAADQDGTRRYWGPGPDGIIGDHSVDPSTDPLAADDTHDVVACWITAPATETIHVSATATGGKPGVAGTMTLTINGVDQTPVAGRTATWDGTLPYSDGATFAGLARYDQPADTAGPAVTHTQAFTITLSPLCASLPASDMFA